jgi:hypothetical protein
MGYVDLNPLLGGNNGYVTVRVQRPDDNVQVQLPSINTPTQPTIHWASSLVARLSNSPLWAARRQPRSRSGCRATLRPWFWCAQVRRTHWTSSARIFRGPRPRRFPSGLHYRFPRWLVSNGPASARTRYVQRHGSLGRRYVERPPTAAARATSFVPAVQSPEHPRSPQAQLAGAPHFGSSPTRRSRSLTLRNDRC